VTVNDGGATNNLVSRSFTVTVVSNVPPTITAIADRIIPVNTNTGPIAFTVGDLETPATNLTVWAVSSNPTLMPTNRIAFSGGESNRTVVLTPVAGLAGWADITIVVSDGSKAGGTTFRLTVQDRPPAPSNLNVVTVQGLGSLQPDLSAQSLVVGQTYTVKAIPAPGQMFAGWTGSTNSLSPTLVFIMAPGVGYQANFAPLTLQTNGLGSLSPNLAAQPLTLGKVYTLKAVPGPGQVFAGWSGSTNSLASTISFVLRTNLTFRANFVPNPFLPISGNYSGLFYEPDGVRQRSSGFFTLSVASRGTYSGKLRLGPNVCSFKGQFGADLRATNFVARGAASALTLELSLGTGLQAEQISGRLTDGQWSAVLLGDRAVFGKRTLLAPFAGRYTLFVPGTEDDPTLPGGEGFGTVYVKADGNVAFAGALADGTKVTQSAPVSRAGHWPLYVPLYRGQGSLVSWVTFTNQPGSDCGGVLSWIKPADVTAAYYPRGFHYVSQAEGSAYVAPLGATTPLQNLTTASVAFWGGNLGPGFTNRVTLAPGGRLMNASSNALSLTFSPSNGGLNGRVTDPVTGRGWSFKGAVFQKRNVAYGFLLATNQASHVLLSP